MDGTTFNVTGVLTREEPEATVADRLKLLRLPSRLSILLLVSLPLPVLLVPAPRLVLVDEVDDVDVVDVVVVVESGIAGIMAVLEYLVRWLT